MLDFAYKYKSEIEDLYVKNVLMNNTYKFYNFKSYWDATSIEILSSDWSEIQRVSIFENKVIGIFRATTSRNDNSISNLGFINFHMDKISLGFVKDMEKFIQYLFEQQFRKINFTVVIGNSSERLYDAFIKKYNGRIVGVQKKEVKLVDQKYYDVKLYEIFLEDYLRSVK